MTQDHELFTDSWREAAACFDTTSVDFFPDADHPAAISTAKAMCAVCPVSSACLTWAVETDQRLGIWGGHTPAERRALRRGWLEEIRRAS